MKIENIKFKAKRLDNGEWVEGDLMKESYGARIIEHTSKATNWIAVDPNTVCQFTGLTDCEGNEIWEGDIVEREIWNRLYNGLTKVKGVIEYKGAEFFVAINSETYSLYPKDIKVVSNKFDKEKYVNQHINLADTSVLCKELNRRKKIGNDFLVISTECKIG